ncbi:MAG: glycosyltransferase family 4 protein [Terriglobales bacterium]
MKLGYIFSRYPLISETFILREMEELASLGHQLEIAPLLGAPALKVHAGHERLRAAIRIAPWLPEGGLATHAEYARRAPCGYWRTLGRSVWSHRGHWNALAGALIFWPKAVAIAARFQAAGIEHVHAHYGTHPALTAWVVHRLTGIPFSFTLHAHDLYVHQAGLEDKLAAAAFVATVSEFNRQWLRRAFPRWAGKVALVRCGVRPAKYLQPRRPLPQGPLRLLCVASLRPYKGHGTLLAACDRLRGRLDFTCRLVGWGPLHAPLLGEVRRRGLDSLVTLAGPATEEEVAEELARADLFVLPSIRERSGRMEGLPVALMEAMAAGVPVIASRLSGIPELVRPGETGCLVEPGDAPALAEAIWELRDAGRRAVLAARAREFVCDEFDLRQSVRQLASLFASAARPPLRSAEAMPAPVAPLSGA